ncbi:MAG: US12 family protein [Planctomycetes bacterium]|nr:US12 family protein [Planctomycetota bacterium]
MEYSNAYASPVAYSEVDARAKFITKTYAHLLGAIAAFVVLEIIFFSTPLAEIIGVTLMSNWLLVIGGLMIVGWLSNHFTASSKSLPQQYFGLGVYVVAQAVIFVPLLYMAKIQGEGVLESAALVTIAGFIGLTAIVFITRKDFSFIGAILKWVGMVALLLIVGSLLFGFQLGTFFSVAMIAFAGGAILYDTSNVLNRYPEDQYVNASLQLFASVALLFWYVLRMFLSSRD